MNNGSEIEYKRGDVYWVLYSDSGYNALAAKRPALIVSSDKYNQTSPTLQIAFLTTKSKFGVTNVETFATGRSSFVVCNQLHTFEKSRFGDYMGTLTSEEMAAVDRGLLISLSVNASQVEEYEEEKRMLEDEIASLKSRVNRGLDDKTSIVVERDLYKRLYEKALEMLATAKMSVEPAPKPKQEVVSEPKVEPEKKVEPASTVEPSPKVEPEKEVEPAPKVEINTCSEEDLRSCGCSLTVIHYIIANRPYKSVEDLKKIPQLTRMAYQILANKLCCVPPKKANQVVPKVKKVNVNTATVAEMMEIAGMPKQLCEAIRAYRNKHGKFEKLEDLLKTVRFGKGCMKMYGSKLEV